MAFRILSPSGHASIVVNRSPWGMPVRERMASKSMFETDRVPSISKQTALYWKDDWPEGATARVSAEPAHNTRLRVASEMDVCRGLHRQGRGTMTRPE